MRRKINILDVSLRDGMHPLKHQLPANEMAKVAAQIDKIGVNVIEFGHGNGLAGSSFQYGFGASTDEEYIKAVTAVVHNTKLGVIILPGIGTRHELAVAREHGVSVARLCTQITECDIAEQHIRMANNMGFEAWAVLPCASALSVEETVKYAQMSESYGAKVVYLLDGGGYLLPEMVYERIQAMSRTLGVETGFHGHNNLQLAVANSKAAIEAGASHIDCCLRGMGAGAGNCPTEIFAAVCDRMGLDTGVDLYSAMDVAEQVIRPLLPKPIEFDKDSLMLGYAGVYSSFLLFAKRAAERYGVDARDVIKEMGKRVCTEGQENLCIECAYDLAMQKKKVHPGNEYMS